MGTNKENSFKACLLREIIRAKYVTRKIYGEEWAVFFECLIGSGARVGDLLKCKGCDILPNGEIIIKQSKGSSPISHKPSSSIHWLEQRCGKSALLFPSINYERVRRLLEREGVLLQREGFKKKNICSIFREARAQELTRQDPTGELARQLLGHKKITSTAHYIGKSAEEVLLIKVKNTSSSSQSDQQSRKKVKY